MTNPDALLSQAGHSTTVSGSPTTSRALLADKSKRYYQATANHGSAEPQITRVFHLALWLLLSDRQRTRRAPTQTRPVRVSQSALYGKLSGAYGLHRHRLQGPGMTA